MKKTVHITERFTKNQERTYRPVYFEISDDVERIDIRYSYLREGATVDLAVCGPNDAFIGASGAAREHIWISPLHSADGFAAVPIRRGTWQITAGLYHVPENGVSVEYTIDLTLKTRRLFKGETHVHTTASDGSASATAIAGIARELGLSYVFLTDHNNYAQNEHAHRAPDISLLPGSEWTLYQGHAGLLGLAKPFEGNYVAHTKAEAISFLERAMQGGATVVLNHPFCPLCPWEWGFDVPYHAIEVWNGVMSERNERAIAYWHQLLCQGKRVPATGGSDYHSPGLLGSLAMPCHAVYAQSREPADILLAIREGGGYISYLPEGPGVDIRGLKADGSPAYMGDIAIPGEAVHFCFTGLKNGDVIRLLTATDTEQLPFGADGSTFAEQLQSGAESVTITRRYTGEPFVRAEVYRVYAPTLPPMKAMLSNALYFGS